VAALRTVIGATDPAEAAPGTIRNLYAESKGRNAIHASDSDENAQREVAFSSLRNLAPFVLFHEFVFLVLGRGVTGGRAGGAVGVRRGGRCGER